MFIPSEIKISAIILHKVGNKANEDGLFFSKQPIKTDEKLNELLINYFFSPFKSEEYFNFYHESDLNLNEVYHYVAQIFDQNNLAVMYEQSVNLAKHLYEKSIHHKIKGGDFFTVFFKDCILHGESVNAVGLFKSENKDDFLKISSNGENFELISEKGIDIKKL
ncbi:MAG: nucleoid-associated protein, partial [Bacteroidales bacterium]